MENNGIFCKEAYHKGTDCKVTKVDERKKSSDQRNCVSTAYVRITETFSVKAQEHVATFTVSITPPYATNQSKGNHLLLKAIKNKK